MVVGGDLNLSYVTTLPNIIKQYSPNLYGYSTGTTPFMNFVNLPNTRLNLALTGGHAENLLQQAQDLVRKVRGNSDIDFDRIANVTAALDYLEQNLPRTFVNLIQLTQIGDLMEQIQMNPVLMFFCRQVYLTNCPCGPYGSAGYSRTLFNQILEQYRQALRDLVGSGRYDNSDSFTVVLQPFQTTVQLNDVSDISSFAGDCTHFSAIGMRDLAVGLWRNLFEGVGEKSMALRIPTEGISCPPDDQSFFLTARNGTAVGTTTTTTATTTTATTTTTTTAAATSVADDDAATTTAAAATGTSTTATTATTTTTAATATTTTVGTTIAAAATTTTSDTDVNAGVATPDVRATEESTTGGRRDTISGKHG